MKWKQPVGYFISSGPISGRIMEQLLKACLDQLQAVGLTVVIVICDPGSNKQNLFTTQLGVTIDHPYFLHGARKIYTMWDPPHLIKNVRNNLKKHGFVPDGKDILWSHLDNFYTAECLIHIDFSRRTMLPNWLVQSPVFTRELQNIKSHSIHWHLLHWFIIEGEPILQPF